MERRPNPLLALAELGQSVWMDYLDRRSLASGDLQRYIEQDGVRGVTSNPSIFNEAIAGSHDYDASIRDLAAAGKSVPEIYEAIVVRDIQLAADLFRPVFDHLSGHDGFVSLEVSPHLARDTAATVVEARRLWTAVDRPNAMIKVPATAEGVTAIEQLVSEGININVTLLFGLRRYEQVAWAYVAGVERRAARSTSVRVPSVASFFLSRIDVLVDAELERMRRAGTFRAPLAARLRGQVAIASAKVAHRIWKEIFGSARFSRLAEQGAERQRLLWASTGTKDPAYSDVKYVEPLIGEATINTVTRDTLNAYRDHGAPAPRLEDEVDEARGTLRDLAAAGINLDDVAQQLEDEGVHKFVRAHDALMGMIAERAAPSRDSGVAGPLESTP